MPHVRQPVPKREPEAEHRLPFGPDFQQSLIRLLCEDPDYARVIADYLEPQYFENEIFAWMIAFLKHYRQTYGVFPSLQVLMHQCATIDARSRPMYQVMVEQIQQAPLRDVDWMKAQTLDFIKRTIFVRTYQESRNLYNAGKVTDAYDLMMGRMEKVSKTAWEPSDEEDYFEILDERNTTRMNTNPSKLSIGTGIHTLNEVLDGGLSIGELGIWVAYPKCGKSTMLINLGVAATRLEFRKTAHFVFEGSRAQVAARYDASFMGEWYHKVKRGEVDETKFQAARREFHMMKGFMKIRGFTDSWDHSVLDIWDALRVWKQTEGWEPEMLIVDYGDLLSGRDKIYPNEREKQKAAFRDLKQLANRGYALWTASQAQRPEKGADEKEHVIHARDIADCYEKVRVADFLGSINLTVEEKKGVFNEQTQQWITWPRARLYAELYRDSDAHETIPVVAEYGKMRIMDPAAVGLDYNRVPQANPARSQAAALV